MTTLNFSLSPGAVGQVSEALICLAKFGEFVSIEARNDKVTRYSLLGEPELTIAVDTDRTESVQDRLCCLHARWQSLLCELRLPSDRIDTWE